MNQKTIHDTTVAECVAADYRTAAIFKKYDIDFCCGGGQTIEKTCQKRGINPDELIRQIEQLQSVDRDPAWDKVHAMATPELIHHIVDHHHQYTRETLPQLHQYSQKVARVHGNNAPETVRISYLVQELMAELEPHMMKEEKILFPMMIKLQEPASELTNHIVNAPIEQMHREHDHAGSIMAEIRKLSNQFIPPDWACNTYKVLYKLLEEFEQDLHRHVHLENNILFPRFENGN